MDEAPVTRNAPIPCRIESRAMSLSAGCCRFLTSTIQNGRRLPKYGEGEGGGVRRACGAAKPRCVLEQYVEGARVSSESAIAAKLHESCGLGSYRPIYGISCLSPLAIDRRASVQPMNWRGSGRNVTSTTTRKPTRSPLGSHRVLRDEWVWCE